MHKMCSDERKCAVMKGCLCSDELRRNKWFTEYLLLREHKEGIETCKIACNRNRKLQTSKAPLKSQVQGTRLFTSAASNQRGFPKNSPWEAQVRSVADPGRQVRGGDLYI